ncbi:hypothetical protein BDZ90DRAFT_262419 [Jaminaea rosea]|uniref:Uncharacterized protein n=1 Tax=Jaminaea rosea TaxID=1569628 RepID=A0A316UJC4_9BASI|nr:hypothetical protein BDZ90DRAFT_262419 [Jaminaea rosea]PWN25366.1 hypothetical protein BDZ90DRAFT_262419 [Jaminaea rosea]
MFAPRARQQYDENASSLATRTPGPSRSRPALSPVKGMATTTATGGKLQRTQSSNTGSYSVSPKKLFSGAGNATPGGSKLGGGVGGRFALGDKTNNKKAPAAGQAPAKVSASPAKSPSKVLRRPPVTPAADKSYATNSAGPSTKGKGVAPTMPLQTPAANIGRRGMMKQRLGEMMDAQRALNGGDEGSAAAPAQDAAPEQGDPASALDDPYGLAELTEEERYPEIEYQPPPLPASVLDQDYGMGAHEKLAGLPSGKELAHMGRGARFGLAHLVREEEKPAMLPEAPEMAAEADGMGAEKRQMEKEELWKSIERDEQEDEERICGRAQKASTPRRPLGVKNGNVAVTTRTPLAQQQRGAPRVGGTPSSSRPAIKSATTLSGKPAIMRNGSATTTSSAKSSSYSGAPPARPAGATRPSGAVATSTMKKASVSVNSSIRPVAPSQQQQQRRPLAATAKPASSAVSRPLQRSAIASRPAPGICDRSSTASAPASAKSSTTQAVADQEEPDALADFAEEQALAGLRDDALGDNAVLGLEMDEDEGAEMGEQTQAEEL